MGKLFDTIDNQLAAWIGRQRLFFVGTAPSGDDGHVNVSPKGPIQSLRILGLRRLAYLDLIGSGAETAAHLRQNGRIVVMLCAFEGPPRIVRLHGRGTVVQVGDPAFAELDRQLDFRDVPAAADATRGVILVDVARVADSCGYGVPLMAYQGERTQQRAWIDSKLRAGPDALLDYVEAMNSASIDGLPAITPETLPRQGQ